MAEVKVTEVNVTAVGEVIKDGAEKTVLAESENISAIYSRGKICITSTSYSGSFELNLLIHLWACFLCKNEQIQS